ncbi:DivIVA domain-containing protein, partial [Candidatus Desantisbacteria bacterium]|nr:DivIVA domain-containing protein [Candidatus Desantisbacteria bacterium]
MKISAEDIKRQKFEIGFRGYNTQEVNTFLQLLSDDYESSLNETERLTKEVAELRKKVEEYKKKEEFLEKAMVTAQRSAEYTNNEAKEQADKIIKEAELNSEKIIGRAEIKAMEIKDEIFELQKQKKQFINQIKSLTENINNYINIHSNAKYEDAPVSNNAAKSSKVAKDKNKTPLAYENSNFKSDLPELESALL